MLRMTAHGCVCVSWPPYDIDQTQNNSVTVNPRNKPVDGGKIYMHTWLVYRMTESTSFLRQGFRKLLYYSLPMHAFSTRGHFCSRHKDGGHIITH